MPGCAGPQVTLGQEEVDEVITRDIHRTFPEHPQFGFAQGQQALFRVLKAYSLHDLEVSYCIVLSFTGKSSTGGRMMVLQSVHDAGKSSLSWGCRRTSRLAGLESTDDEGSSVYASNAIGSW